MDEALTDLQVAKIMEPLYRMKKVVEKRDAKAAVTLMALAVQTITDEYIGRQLTPADIQEILRRVLLHYDQGKYYTAYLFNELEVKIAGWLTMLAIDRPVTLGALGQLADVVAQELASRSVLELSARAVLDMVKAQTQALDAVVYERVLLNESHFLSELQTLLLS